MTIQITTDDVARVATLARIALRPDEVTLVAAQLGAILEHFAVLQAIDTADVPTSDDVTGLVNVGRADEAQPEQLCESDTLLERAPATADGQVKVRAVFS